MGSPRDGAGSPAGFGVAGPSARGRASELADAVTDLPLEQLTPLLRVIADKHKRLVMDDKQVSMHVLRDFLALSHRRKNEAVDVLEREIGCIDDDLEWVERQVAELGGSRALDAFAEEASRETDPKELARRRAAGERAGHAQMSPQVGRAKRRVRVQRRRCQPRASMVRMLSAWGIDGGMGGGAGGARAAARPRGPSRIPGEPRRGATEFDGHDARRGAEQARRERQGSPEELARDGATTRAGLPEARRPAKEPFAGRRASTPEETAVTNARLTFRTTARPRNRRAARRRRA